MTELLNSRVRITEKIPSEVVVVESPPNDIFIEVTDDLLSNIPKTSSSSQISSPSEDVPVLLDLDKLPERDLLSCSVQNDLVHLLDTTLHFEDIPVVLENAPVSEEYPDHEESINLINFDEINVAAQEETSEYN